MIKTISEHRERLKSGSLKVIEPGGDYGKQWLHDAQGAQRELFEDVAELLDKAEAYEECDKVSEAYRSNRDQYRRGIHALDRMLHKDTLGVNWNKFLEGMTLHDFIWEAGQPGEPKTTENPVLACKDCKKLPSVERFGPGWGVGCDCYAPTHSDSDEPEPSHHTESHEFMHEAIKLWNEKWGTA